MNKLVLKICDKCGATIEAISIKILQYFVRGKNGEN